MSLQPVSVALKFGFIAVIYLFLLWIARSARRDLRGSPASEREAVPTGLGEPREAKPRRLDRQPCLGVVGGHPAGSEPELEATVRQDICGSRFLGNQSGMPEVVV